MNGAWCEQRSTDTHARGEGAQPSRAYLSSSEPRPALAPPPSNREAQLTQWHMEVGLHYLTGTSERTVQEVLGVMGKFLGEFEQAERGTKLYDQLWQGVAGAQVQYGNRLSGSEDVYLVMPGEVCEILGVENLVSIGTLLDLKPTRIDSAIDYAPFTPRHLNEAYKQGCINTRVRRGGKGRRFIESDTGDTFYLGAPKSDTMLRCYNERGPTRVEIQLRRNRAKQFWDLLMSNTLEDLGELTLGVIRSHVDFVIPSETDINKSRWALLPFWKDFIGGVKKLRLTLPKSSVSIEKMKEYIRKQAAMLVTYIEVMVHQGHNPVIVAKDLLRHGRARQKAKHRHLLRASYLT